MLVIQFFQMSPFDGMKMTSVRVQHTSAAGSRRVRDSFSTAPPAATGWSDFTSDLTEANGYTFTLAGSRQMQIARGSKFARAWICFDPRSSSYFPFRAGLRLSSEIVVNRVRRSWLTTVDTVVPSMPMEKSMPRLRRVNISFPLFFPSHSHICLCCTAFRSSRGA